MSRTIDALAIGASVLFHGVVGLGLQAAPPVEPERVFAAVTMVPAPVVEPPPPAPVVEPPPPVVEPPPPPPRPLRLHRRLLCP